MSASYPYSLEHTRTHYFGQIIDQEWFVFYHLLSDHVIQIHNIERANGPINLGSLMRGKKMHYTSLSISIQPISFSLIAYSPMTCIS